MDRSSHDRVLAEEDFFLPFAIVNTLLSVVVVVVVVAVVVVVVVLLLLLIFFIFLEKIIRPYLN
jgi:hypothetical protein